MFNLDEDVPARRLAYLSALLLIVVPLAQAVSQLWPLQFGNIQWRFQAAGSLSSVLLLPYLGLVIYALIARSTGANGAAKVIGIIAAIMTVVLAASVVVFALDALQLKAIVTSRAMDGFKVASVRVASVSFVFTLLFGYMAMALLRGAKGSKAASSGKASRKATVSESDDDSGLLIG